MATSSYPAIYSPSDLASMDLFASVLPNINYTDENRHSAETFAVSKTVFRSPSQISGTNSVQHFYKTQKMLQMKLLDIDPPFDPERGSAPIVIPKSSPTLDREQHRNVTYPSRPKSAAATVLQIWEGRVDSVDDNTEEMVAQLVDKTGTSDAHVATISLEWVAQQDRELVKPGAVFYLTQSKYIRNGTVKNEQELRFRRLPNWTARAVKEIYNEADRMLAVLRGK